MLFFKILDRNNSLDKSIDDYHKYTKKKTEGYGQKKEQNKFNLFSIFIIPFGHVSGDEE